MLPVSKQVLSQKQNIENFPIFITTNDTLIIGLKNFEEFIRGLKEDNEDTEINESSFKVSCSLISHPPLNPDYDLIEIKYKYKKDENLDKNRFKMLLKCARNINGDFFYSEKDNIIVFFNVRPMEILYSGREDGLEPSEQEKLLNTKLVDFHKESGKKHLKDLEWIINSRKNINATESIKETKELLSIKNKDIMTRKIFNIVSMHVYFTAESFLNNFFISTKLLLKNMITVPEKQKTILLQKSIKKKNSPIVNFFNKVIFNIKKLFFSLTLRFTSNDNIDEKMASGVSFFESCQHIATKNPTFNSECKSCSMYEDCCLISLFLKLGYSVETTRAILKGIMMLQPDERKMATCVTDVYPNSVNIFIKK